MDGEVGVAGVMLELGVCDCQSCARAKTRAAEEEAGAPRSSRPGGGTSLTALDFLDAMHLPCA